jgi:hypothetical protein
VFLPPRKEVNKITLSSNFAGLELFNTFWKEQNFAAILDKEVEKKSGADFSDIIKNVTCGHILGYDSLEDLADKTLKEELLRGNCLVSRSTYSRNMNALAYNKQNTILAYVVTQIIRRLRRSRKPLCNAIGIIDGSPLSIGGETYERAQWVHDGRQNCLVWGYEVNTLLIQVGNYAFPFQFRVNDFSKKGIMMMTKRMIRMLGIRTICFDAGYKGMEFFKELEELNVKFYTKATKNWKFEKHSWEKSAKKWAEQMEKVFKRNHRYASKLVTKEGMKFLLVKAKDDPRTFLTNNCKATAKEVYNMYARRWKIETSFREEKQNLGFEQLTVRKINAIQTHIMTVFIAYIFCQLCLQKFPKLDGVKLLIRKVFHNAAHIIRKGTNIVVKFLEKFYYRKKLERLLQASLV